MLRLTNISSDTLPILQNLAIFGIGSYIVYILPIFVIIAFEHRQAKMAQGQDSILSYSVKAIFYSLFWLFFVSIFVFGIIDVGDSGKINPVYAIWGFFHIDWLDPAVYNSIKSGVLASASAEELSQGRMLGMLLMIAKLLYVITLMGMFFLIFSFSYSLVFVNQKKNNDDMDFGFVVKFGLSAIVSIIAYKVIFGVLGTFLSSTAIFADSIGKAPAVVSSNTDFDIVSDLALFAKVGINALSLTIP